jgi:hypothetical protein
VADVFISYSQKTPEAAAALAESLKAKGYDVWWDMRLNAGDRFDDVIREQLDDADAVIVIWSAESVRSKYVTMEAGMALGWSKLIPVRAADLPLAEVPAAFQRLQTCDAADIESIDRALQTKGLRPQQAGRRKALSREELISELGRVDQSLPASVGTWLRRCQQEEFRIVAKRSLMIKATIPNFGDANFGTLFPDGTLQTNYISESSERLGDPSIAADYLDGLARLIEGASVRRDGMPWNWRVEVFGQLPKISSLLERSDEWLALMKAARERFVKTAASGLER